MNFHLLDAGGAGLAFAALIIFMIIAVTVEALIMLLLKYNFAGKAFLDSFLVNIASLVAGYLLTEAIGRIFVLTESVLLNWLLVYAITVVIEFLILYLLNRKKPIRKTLLTCMAMNGVSYIVLYLFVEGVSL